MITTSLVTISPYKVIRILWTIFPMLYFTLCGLFILQLEMYTFHSPLPFSSFPPPLSVTQPPVCPFYVPLHPVIFLLLEAVYCV